MLDVDRTQVMAYRVLAHQLDRSCTEVDELAVLDLGVQDTPYGVARQALAARLEQLPGQDDLALLWAARGAPHLHRWADLPHIARALWPLSDADATARINVGPIREGAKMGLAAFVAAATAMRNVVTEEMAKGDVSREVSARVPEQLTYWCQACDAQHISGALFQQAGPFAAVRLIPGKKTTLAPVEDPWDMPEEATGTNELIRAYLRLHGPAAHSDAAKFLGTTATAVRSVWPEGLAEVRVEGRRAWLPEERLDELRSAPRSRVVRLLPPMDPLLQARDRDVLVPGRERQKELWRTLASPGALLADGEVAGTWRAKVTGKRLDVTITPFEQLPAQDRAAAEGEAARLAGVRGARDVRVEWSSG